MRGRPANTQWTLSLPRHAASSWNSFTTERTLALRVSQHGRSTTCSLKAERAFLSIPSRYAALAIDGLVHATVLLLEPHRICLPLLMADRMGWSSSRAHSGSELHTLNNFVRARQTGSMCCYRHCLQPVHLDPAPSSLPEAPQVGAMSKNS